jgi:hypothetical protein
MLALTICRPSQLSLGRSDSALTIDPLRTGRQEVEPADFERISTTAPTSSSRDKSARGGLLLRIANGAFKALTLRPSMASAQARGLFGHFPISWTN